MPLNFPEKMFNLNMYVDLINLDADPKVNENQG